MYGGCGGETSEAGLVRPMTGQLDKPVVGQLTHPVKSPLLQIQIQIKYKYRYKYRYNYRPDVMSWPAKEETASV